MLEGFFDALFGWSVSLNPMFGIAFVSLLLTLLSTLAYKYFTDQDLMKRLKEESKSMQKEIKAYSNDPKKMGEMNSQMMGNSKQMFKQQWKPMLITMVPFLLVFGWLRDVYEPMGKVFFGTLTWFWGYLILALIFSFALRKLLKVY